jgi:hypothetical protein
VADAADALEKSAYANAIDSNNGMHTWTLTRNGVQVVPVATGSAQANWLATTATEGEALLAAAPAQKVNGSAAAGAPPRLEFTVDIETGGTYHLFVNSSNPNANADSYHVAVDEQWKYHSSKGGEETGYRDVVRQHERQRGRVDPCPRAVHGLALGSGGRVPRQPDRIDDECLARVRRVPGASERERLNNPPVIASVTTEPDTGEAARPRSRSTSPSPSPTPTTASSPTSGGLEGE